MVMMRMVMPRERLCWPQEDGSQGEETEWDPTRLLPAQLRRHGDHSLVSPLVLLAEEG